MWTEASGNWEDLFVEEKYGWAELFMLNSR